jgi:hypothetical protein
MGDIRTGRRAKGPAEARVGLVGLLGILTATAPVAAQTLSRPTLHCDVRQADITRRFEARPTADPYGVASHDIDGRFRFKAVVGAGTTGEAAYVKLHVYDMAVKGAPVLLHMATHQPPWPAGHEVPALTGWNHVYSSVLGRELVYGCAWQEGAP